MYLSARIHYLLTCLVTISFLNTINISKAIDFNLNIHNRAFYPMINEHFSYNEKRRLKRQPNIYPKLQLFKNNMNYFKNKAKNVPRKSSVIKPYDVDKSIKSPGNYSTTTEIILLNILTYILQVAKPTITQYGAKKSKNILIQKQFYRLFTPIFLHANPSHLLLNCYSLRKMGPEVERLFNKQRFLMTYIISGIMGNLASAYMSPNPSLGASGAVFGIMGGYYVFLTQNQKFFCGSGTHLELITKILFTNAVYGYFSQGIDNWCHIGGLLGGAMTVMAFGPKLYSIRMKNGHDIVVDMPLLSRPKCIQTIGDDISNVLHRVNFGLSEIKRNMFEIDILSL